MKKSKISIILIAAALSLTACGIANNEGDNSIKNVEQEDVITQETQEDLSEDAEKPFNEEVDTEHEIVEPIYGYAIEEISIYSNTSEDSEILGSVSYNTKLEIINETEEWYEIQAGNQSGYVRKPYISKTEMPELIDDYDIDVNEIIENSKNEEQEETDTMKAEAGTIISGNEYQQRLLNEINQWRNEYGIEDLVLTDLLCQSAEERVNEVSASLSHTRPDGSDWYTSLKFTTVRAASEIVGTANRSSMIEIWKQQDGSNSQLLNAEYTLCGIGSQTDGEGNIYAVVHLY